MPRLAIAALALLAGCASSPGSDRALAELSLRVAGFVESEGIT
jgi:hypothetical protein